jgi:hypothetical protein
MSLVSTRSVWDWAEQLAAKYSEPFDLVLREILVAVERRELSARNPEDPDETWRILLPVMVDHIDRDRRGNKDPEPVLGPGILGIAGSILIDATELDRWLTARGIKWSDPFSTPAAASPAASSTKGANNQVHPVPEWTAGYRTNKAGAAEEACRQWIAGLNERPTNKEAAFDQARAAVKEIGPLTGKAFERAWASTAPAEWRRGGRRKQLR